MIWRVNMDKRKVQDLLDGEPENVDVELFLSRLLLLEKIERAEVDLADGKGIPHAEVRRRLSKWLAN